MISRLKNFAGAICKHQGFQKYLKNTGWLFGGQMLRLALGWGAGSFRYIFPMYQRNYPKIYYHYYHQKKGWIGRQIHHYAHKDIVQFVAEYGVIGSGLVLLVLMWILFSAFHTSSFSAFFLLFGFASSMSHAFFDFIFNSPAYWMAFLGLLAASSKLLQMESARRVQ